MPVEPVIELQLSAHTFLDAQLLTLQTEQLAFPAPFSIGGYQFVVDHVEFGASSFSSPAPVNKFIYYNQLYTGITSTSISATRPQISQAVTIVVVSLQDVEANPNGVPQHPIPFNVTMVLGVDYIVQGYDTDVMTVSVDHVVPGPLPTLPPGVDPNQVNQQLIAFLSSASAQSINLGLAKVAETGSSSSSNSSGGSLSGPGLVANQNPGIGTDPSFVLNAGVAVSSDLQRICFRLEFGVGDSTDPSTWQTFYTGNFIDRLLDSAGKERSLAVYESSAVLESTTSATIYSGLIADQQKHESDAVHLDVTTGVSTHYSDNAGVASLTSQFSGDLHTPACTVHIDVTVASTTSIVQTNTLTVDSNYSWNSDTDACTVIAGVLGAAIGIFTNFIFPLSDMLIEPVFFSVAGMAAVLVAKNVVSPPSNTPSDCNQLSDTHIVCNQKLNVANSPIGNLALNALVAQTDGISLVGDFDPVPVGIPQMSTTIETEFTWYGPSISCGQISGQEVNNYLKNPKDFSRLKASASVTALTIAPIFFISASIVNDPLNVFSVAAPAYGTQAPFEITVDIPYPGDQFFVAPYGCQILVQTTGGTRDILIPAPPPLSQLQIEELAAQIAGQVLFCQKLVDQWWLYFHQYNPVWGVDPSIGENSVEHGYEVEITGLNVGEIATLLGARNELLQTGIAQAGSSLRLSAVVSPSGDGELGILRGEAGANNPAPPAPAPRINIAEDKVTLPIAPASRGIAVKEQLIIRAGTIQLTQPCRSLAAAYLGNAPKAIVVTDSRVLSFDLSNVAAPASSDSWTVPGIRGVLVQPLAPLAFGQDGLALLAASGIVVPVGGCCGSVEPEYHDVASAGAYVYAISSRGLEVFSSRMRLRHIIPLEHAHSIAHIGNKLVIGGKKGYTVFHLGDPARPEFGQHQAIGSVAELVVPPGSSGHQLLVVPYEGAAQLVDFAGHGEAKLVATFSALPWYVGAARIGNYLLRPSSDRLSVSVSYFGNSVTI